MTEFFAASKTMPCPSLEASRIPDRAVTEVRRLCETGAISRAEVRIGPEGRFDEEGVGRLVDALGGPSGLVMDYTDFFVDIAPPPGSEDDILAAQEELAGPESPWRAAGAFVHEYIGRWFRS